MIAKSPLVTVLLPVYNGEKYLSASIESILRQNYRDFELLIINDGSFDSTSEILKRYEKRDQRIRVHNQDNHGIVFALNKGIDLAIGKYIARIDSDDIMTQHSLEYQVNLLEKKTNVGVVGSWMEIINEHDITLTYWKLPYKKEDFDYWTYLNGEIRIGHPCVMYRTDLIRSLGGYRSDYIDAEDVDLWFRVELSGFELINIPKYLTSYRQHNFQITNQNRDSSVNSRNKALADYLSHKLNCDINSETASLICPSNYSNKIINSQERFKILFDLKYKMFNLFIKKNKFTRIEINRYAFKICLSLWPLCRILYSNPLRAIYQNTILFMRFRRLQINNLEN